MKKIMAIILALTICFCFCACGNGSKEDVEPTESVTSKITSQVEWQVAFRVSNQYDITGWPGVHCNSVKEISENKYHISGKVYCRDAYGDGYSGNFDADATYNPGSDSVSVSNVKIDKMYRN